MTSPTDDGLKRNQYRSASPISEPEYNRIRLAALAAGR